MVAKELSKNRISIAGYFPVYKPVFRVIAALALISIFAGAVKSETYEVNIPEQWNSKIAVGKATVDCNAFYGIPWHFGLYPVVRLNLPVENLTSKTLYFKFNYTTKSKIKGYSNSGMGVTYTLAPSEKHLIDTIVPVASITRPIKFLIRMSEPSENPDTQVSADNVIITIDPFKISPSPSHDISLKKVKNEYFEIKEAQLTLSPKQDNLVTFQVQNLTDREQKLGLYIGVNDPVNMETKIGLARSRGFISRTIEAIPAKNTKNITIPYNIPPVGPGPVLVYTLFKPNIEVSYSGNRDSRDWDIILAGYGSFDLTIATGQGLCIIPVHEPVEERAKLTTEKKSKHFIFRYRPGTYAEKNIDRAVSEREQAYDKLSKALQMELPVTVKIDLYPDMEAKGLGSGTTWTPANTRSNKHICEVFNDEYQCDPYHELAHIFSYHFPNYSSNQGGIVEAFAAYFEPSNMQIGPTTKFLKKQLSEGKLPSLLEVLQSQSSGQELVILIDFLLKKDVEKFKQLYVIITKSQKPDIEKAVRQIYETDINDLEKQWHEFINRESGI
ncbi:MAG: hypothetical protein JW715_10405 [Sedimentisphaerales bacterium]|nr:hypothetical protein [Sedimentisphaerales bacterium]